MLNIDEEQRIEELHRYKILFTEPEAVFDRITALAKRLFHVPIVLVSLVEKDFQWFKSCIGLSISSTSREVSFCQYTMREERVFIIKDATLDPQFSQNALVTGAPGIRFYAGAPLISPRGFGLGALCIIDTAPRPEGLSAEDEQSLMEMAEIVVSELELRSANEKLTDMKAELERSNEEFSKFSHVVSHDLQTPLRTIKIFAQMLRRRLVGKLSEEEDQQFQLITSASDRMNELITGLLRFAEVGQEPITREDIAMEEVIASTVLNLGAIVEETQAQILYDRLPVIQGDRLQLSQLFQNLISNSLKYRAHDRSPRVLVRAARIDQQWQFCVEDNGQGIAPSNQAKIFEPLTRLHGAEIPGSGIGLAICRSIVQRHGGQISLTSEVDKGTTFYINLPVT